MNKKAYDIFSLLEKYAIPFYLLRPIDLNEALKDIDVLISKSDTVKLISKLKENNVESYYKRGNAQSSVQVFIEGLLLDIKHHVCFMPRKSLTLNLPIPVTGIVTIDDRYIYPEIDESTLFSLWTYHLLLDKTKPSDSSTYLIYKNRYKESFKQLLQTDYFIALSREIFHLDKDHHLIIADFFNNKMEYGTVYSNKDLKKLILNYSFYFKIKFYLDKYYFKILRKCGKTINTRSLSKFS